MPSKHQPYCPHLGLHADRASVYTRPTEEHRCHVAERRQRIDLDHQATFCLTSGFETCPRYAAPPPAPPSRVERSPALRDLSLDALPTTEQADRDRPSRLRLLRLRDVLEGAPWLQLGVWIIIALVGLAGVYYYLNVRRSLAPIAAPMDPTGPEVAVVTPTPSPSPLPTGTPTVPPRVVPVAASTPVPASPQTAPTAPLPPERLQTVLYPAGNAVGWVSSSGPLNNFGDRVWCG